MTRTDQFKIGLFVLAGLAVGIGTLIWIGTFELFQKTNSYVTYLNESVEGLSAGSEVKFLGIRVGKVRSVEIASNQELIKVVLDLRSDFHVDQSLALQIATSGLTGPKFLAVGKAPADILEQTPAVNLKTQYPVIPSYPGQLSKIEKNLEKIAGKLEGLDLQGLVEEWKQAGHDAGAAVGNPAIRDSVENISRASKDLSRILDTLGREPGSAKEWKKSLSDIAATAHAAKKASEALSAQLQALPPKSLVSLDKRVDRIIDLSEALIRLLKNQSGQSLALIEQDLIEVHQFISELKLLVEAFKEQPSRILTRPRGGEPFKR